MTVRVVVLCIGPTTLRTIRRANMKGKANHRQAKSSSNGTERGDKKEKKMPSLVSGFHGLTRDDCTSCQTQLLEWYDANKRDLPWRHQSKVSDDNQRAYGVWVSEIMLQQTQVATVIDYYNRWMKKWPTLQDLSKAKLEEVNEMWSGLGYYSRGKRLHEGAQKVVSELQGEMPRSCEELQKQLPGVGRYTAGAIASIAFGQKTGVVDGNVIRVLSRLRIIGADTSSPATMDMFWSLANQLADCDRPGDLNQSLMELGATVCTPKTPQCASCPIAKVCKAYAKVQGEKKENAGRLMQKDTSPLPDIECLAESCSLCLSADDPWDSSLGVQNFPRKAKKKAAREQTSFVCVVCKICQGNQRKFLILQRPEKGLLAGLWEFPSSDMDTTTTAASSRPDAVKQLKNDHGVHISSVESKTHHGEVVHIFSHIHQTYMVSMVIAVEDNITVTTERPARWLTQEELSDAALSTAMRKVFKLCSGGNNPGKTVKRKREESAEEKGKQRSIDSFFKRKS